MSSSTIMEYTDQIELLYASWAEMIRVHSFNGYELTGYLQLQDTNPHDHFREAFRQHVMYLDPHWLGPLQPLYRHARFAGYQPTSEDDASSDYASTLASSTGTTDLDMPALLIATPVVRKRSKSLECRPRLASLTPHHIFCSQNRHRAKSA